MRSFEYQAPTRILVGPGQVEAISELVPEDAKVLCIFGGGSAAASGALEAVRGALGSRVRVEHFGVPPNPTIEDAEPILLLELALGADFILAVGGGSVLDLAKFVAAACRSDESDLLTFLLKGKKPPSPLPVGAIVTRAGTGSEANGISAIGCRRTQQKLVYSHPGTRPRFAILDPNLLRSLPRAAFASGVADAFVHVLEQTATYPHDGLVQEQLAEALLRSLLMIGTELGEPELKDQTISNFLWAASLAQGGLIATGTPEDWATHFIGHELTALLGLDHPETLSLILPIVYRARFEKKKERLAQIGARVFGLEGASIEAIANETIDRITRFFDSLGLRTNLRALELTEEQIQRIIQGLKAARRVRLGERLDLGLPEVESLLRAAALGTK